MHWGQFGWNRKRFFILILTCGGCCSARWFFLVWNSILSESVQWEEVRKRRTFPAITPQSFLLLIFIFRGDYMKYCVQSEKEILVYGLMSEIPSISRNKFIDAVSFGSRMDQEKGELRKIWCFFFVDVFWSIIISLLGGAPSSERS